MTYDVCCERVGGYRVFGQDVYRYPVVPIITRIWGCNNNNIGNDTLSTSLCPTQVIIAAAFPLISSIPISYATLVGVSSYRAV